MRAAVLYLSMCILYKQIEASATLMNCSHTMVLTINYSTSITAPAAAPQATGQLLVVRDAAWLAAYH